MNDNETSAPANSAAERTIRKSAAMIEMILGLRLLFVFVAVTALVASLVLAVNGVNKWSRTQDEVAGMVEEYLDDSDRVSSTAKQAVRDFLASDAAKSDMDDYFARNGRIREQLTDAFGQWLMNTGKTLIATDLRVDESFQAQVAARQPNGASKLDPLLLAAINRQIDNLHAEIKEETAARIRDDRRLQEDLNIVMTSPRRERVITRTLRPGKATTIPELGLIVRLAELDGSRASIQWRPIGGEKDFTDVTVRPGAATGGLTCSIEGIRDACELTLVDYSNFWPQRKARVALTREIAAQ